ncbi:hypothetical protein F5884DRAFT_756506 [Xylogone sp. PMI_703]|nr:hypothetical protein F5884DRAFT_756506 [Xylogone sp. PMI_703]
MDDGHCYFRENSVEADPVLRQHLDQAWQRVLTTQLTARLEVLQRTQGFELGGSIGGGYSSESSLEPVGMMSATPSPTSSRSASPRPESIFSIDSIDSIATNSSNSSPYTPLCMSDYETKQELSSDPEIARECGSQRRKTRKQVSRSTTKSNKISKPTRRRSHDNFTMSSDTHSMILRSRSHNARPRRACVKVSGTVGYRKGGYRDICVP